MTDIINRIDNVIAGWQITRTEIDKALGQMHTPSQQESSLPELAVELKQSHFTTWIQPPEAARPWRRHFERYVQLMKGASNLLGREKSSRLEDM